MKKATLILIFSFLLSGVFAQNQTDALRYSQIEFGGTARSMGVAGAFGAVGGDFSTLSTNPAGMGFYRSSEFTISPAINHSVTNSTFFGENHEESQYDIALQNFGVILSFTQHGKYSGWNNFQFGIGKNRLIDFNNGIHTEGFNTETSILTGYADYANNFGNVGKAPDNMYAFDTYLAYETDLLFDRDTTNAYLWTVDLPGGQVTQRIITETRGYIDEMTISFSGNYKNRLYFGTTIGVPTIDYTREVIYKEFDTQNNSEYFNSLTRTETLHTTGTGINLKLGMIFRATKWLRLGAAYHTPTFYNDMQDNWTAHMTSTFDNGDHYSSGTPQGKYNYELETPARLIGSAAFFIGQNGFLSIDYETVDYSSAKLSSDGGDFSDANNNIHDLYSKQNNLRIGTEWRFDNFYFRGGYANYGSAADGTTIKEFKTLGLGYKTRYFGLDLAFVNSEYDSDYYIYDAGYVPSASNTHETNQFILTFSYKF